MSRRDAWLALLFLLAVPALGFAMILFGSGA